MKTDRLHQALILLGYMDADDPFQRSNLVLAIQLFAGIQQDDVLETECEIEIKKIHAEVAASRVSQPALLSSRGIHNWS